MVDDSKKRYKVAMKHATKGPPGPILQSPCKKPFTKKRSRKVDNPKQLQEQSQGSKYPDKPRICKNSACRKVQSEGEEFCRRCSCCICFRFDDNKDPSNWVECKYQSGGERDKCGLSCHVECALEKHEVGVVYDGPTMRLDGGYHCRFCGTVSGILDFWKKQMVIAKHSRRLDTLSYKINLSCRLLDGSLKFKELHEVAIDAKAKLESEIGPTDMDSANTLHGLVGRLSIAEDVRNLCSVAIEKVDQLLPYSSDANPVTKGHGCNFVCDEVTMSSVQITVLGILSAVMPDGLKGYKVWHHKTREEIRPEAPTHVIPKTLKTVTITGLQPATEYTFRVAAYTEAGDWGHSERTCVTKGLELVAIEQSHMYLETEIPSGMEQNNATGISSSELRVRNLGTLLSLTAADKLGSSSRGFCRAGDMEERAGDRPGNSVGHNSLSGHSGLNLNLVTAVPDLNEEVLSPNDPSKGGEANVLGKFNGNSENNGEQGFQIQVGSGLVRKTGNSKEDAQDDNLEHYIRTIRRLEREGHISSNFRLNLLTWFCVRSTQFQRRLVRLYIDNFAEDPKELAKQLAHSFPDIVPPKRQKNV